MVDTKQVIVAATDKAMKITPSVLVMARLLKVAPKAFAAELYNDKENDSFLSKVVSEAVAVAVAKAHEKRKKDCDDDTEE